ncbi:MAG TPA: diversity-generating retroelement protein Avd [Anaerolineaceae bacterium]
MNESPIFVKTHDLLQWLIPQVQKFPRAHRFGLAERIQRTAMDFQDSLIAAGKSQPPERAEHLKQADILLEQLRFWMRLSYDLHLFDIGQYEHVSRIDVEIGRLLGGWMKKP